MSRNRISIMATMLDVAREGALKTGIMYGANVTLAQLNTFLEYLKVNGLLEEITEEEQQRTKKFYTTPKGFLFLEKFRKLRELFAHGEDQGSDGEEDNYPF
ncbi:MAG: winged helix-turn-helix domain-containing protein [Nitrososphaerales archaeon]